LSKYLRLEDFADAGIEEEDGEDEWEDDFINGTEEAFELLVVVGLVFLDDSDLLGGFVLFDEVDFVVEEADLGHIADIVDAVLSEVHSSGIGALLFVIFLLLFAALLVLFDFPCDNDLCNRALLDSGHDIFVGDGQGSLPFEFVHANAAHKIDDHPDEILMVVIVVFVHLLFFLLQVFLEIVQGLL
jgi:hypothetical protein